MDNEIFVRISASLWELNFFVVVFLFIFVTPGSAQDFTPHGLRGNLWGAGDGPRGWSCARQAPTHCIISPAPPLGIFNVFTLKLSFFYSLGSLSINIDLDWKSC